MTPGLFVIGMLRGARGGDAALKFVCVCRRTGLPASDRDDKVVRGIYPEYAKWWPFLSPAPAFFSKMNANLGSTPPSRRRSRKDSYPFWGFMNPQISAPE